MKTFNDYTDLEKANLTEEEVEGLLKFELMEQGVVAPIKPELLPEDEPEIEEKVYYRPSLKSYSGLDCAFATAKEAEAFLALSPLIFDEGYPTYRKNVQKPEEVKVEAVKVITKADYDSAQAAIQKAADNKSRNKERTEKYEEETQKVSEATLHIWTAWAVCKAKKIQSQQVVDLYAQYVKDCDGNVQIALRFLGKAYSSTEIENAYGFLELPYPLPAKEMAEEAVTA